MLELLRKQTQNTAVWVALGVIIFVFIFFFGPQTSGFAPGSRSWSGKVAGQTIYDQQILARYELMTLLTGNRQRPSEAEFAEIRRQILLDMSAVHLLAERARDAGLEVSEDELRCYLVNWHRGYVVGGETICQGFPEDYADRYPNGDFIRWYSENNQLSPSYRQDVRARFRMAIDEFEAWKRQELLALKFLDLLDSSVAVPPSLVQSTWERRNTTVDLEFLRLDPATVSRATVTDAEVAAWLATSEAEVRAAYDERIDDYTEERQVRLRTLFLRRPAESDASARAEAQETYEALLARAEGGEDFEALVRENTELESDRESGGDMGLLPVSRMNEQLLNAADALEVGGVTGVEFETFYRIVKLEEDVPANVRPFDEVRDELARELLTEQAIEVARGELIERGRRVLEIAASEGVSLQDAATQEAEEATAALAAEAAAAVEATEGEDTDADADGEDTDAVEDTAAVAATVAPLAVGSTGAFGQEREGQVLEGLGQDGSDVVLPAPAQDTIPQIGRSAELSRVAFELTADEPVYAEPVEVAGVSYFVRLAERVDAPDEAPADEIAAVHEELRSRIADELVGVDAARLRLTLNIPGTEYGPYVTAMLQEAIDDGRIRINEGHFRVDPVDELVE